MTDIAIYFQNNILYAGPAKFDIKAYIGEVLEPNTLWVAYTTAEDFGVMVLAQDDGTFKYYQLYMGLEDLHLLHIENISTRAHVEATFSDKDPLAFKESESKYKRLQNSINALGLLYPTKKSIAALLDHPDREIRLFAITKILPQIQGRKYSQGL